MRSQGFEPGIILETVLIDKVMKCGRVQEAFQLFENMTDRNVVTWTSVVSGCVKNNDPELGLSLFVQMLKSGIVPNNFTFNVAFQACADLTSFDTGKQVHSLAIRTGCTHDSRIQNCLIHFYSKCGFTVYAREVLKQMSEPDLVSFTSMIAGYVKNNMLESAFEVFNQMRCLGIMANEHTVASILSTCRSWSGKQVHAYMIKAMLNQSFYSGSALIKFYSDNNFIEGAETVFRKLDLKNVVTWSLMISCYLQNELVSKAMALFCEMVYFGIEPNQYTMATVIGGCGLSTESRGFAKQIHGLVIKLNFHSDDRVSNALLTMYARMGKVEELATVFENICDPDIVSWCAAVSGYSQNGCSEKSASLLCLMQRKGIKPNEYGLSSALSSCADLALLDQGRQFHGLALKLGCDFDACVGNALVNLYAKCGAIADAKQAFDGIPMHDILSWNTLIHGYAHHGHGKEAIQAFDKMQEIGLVIPNHVTLVGVLSACSHVGYIDEAIEYLKNMERHYGLAPSMSHYACVIDMMGRAGCLNEAFQIVNEMPYEPDSLIWKTLAGSCKVYGKLELGKLAAKEATKLSPDDPANYVLLSNLYAVSGRWEDAKRTRMIMDEKGLKKEPGYSWIEVKGQVHSFVAGEKSHKKTQEIYEMLEGLLKEMKEVGYSPNWTQNCTIKNTNSCSVIKQDDEIML
ncbi:pentatricopeptide repeat-containing protein At2g27610-like [Aristolochia californica]|uniref:pentatricopeptide repeat-containing protein At2g27610-like n=1 Tax=Aristolochia californica TaxID=171875 RepID=UPI0035E21189